MPFAILHLTHNERLHELAIVGDGCPGHQDLQRCRRYQSLAHAGNIGVTRGPVLALVDPLPLRVWDEPILFAGQCYTGPFIVAQGAGIFLEPEDAQPFFDFISETTAQLVKTDITRIRNTMVEIQLSEACFVDHSIALVDPVNKIAGVLRAARICWTEALT